MINSLNSPASCLKRKCFSTHASCSRVDHIFLWLRFNPSVTQPSIWFGLTYWIVGFVLSLRNFRHQYYRKRLFGLVWLDWVWESLLLEYLGGKRKGRNKKGKMSEDQPVGSLQERLLFLTQGKRSNGGSEHTPAPADFLPFCHHLSLNLDPLLLQQRFPPSLRSSFPSATTYQCMFYDVLICSGFLPKLHCFQ